MHSNRFALFVAALLVSGQGCSCGGVAPGRDGGGGSGGSGATAAGGNSSGSAGGASSGGTSAGSGGSSGTGTLELEPRSATLVVDGTGPKTASFTLELVAPDGTRTPVDAQSVAFDRPDLATVALGNPIVATAPSALGLHGGSGNLIAISGGQQATASLEVKVAEVNFGAGLAASSPSVQALQQPNLPPDPAPDIRPLLYPYDGTVFPLGLTSPPVMWNAPQSGDVYRLHYAEKDYTFDDYATLAQLPGSMRLDQAAWDRITASNQAARGADPLTFMLSRYDAASQTAYASASETWTIAPESLRGSIYYWTTSNGGSLSRVPPGAGAVPMPLSGPNGNNCMGCHAVSADGSVLVAGVRGQSATDSNDDRAWTSFDLPAGTVRKVSTLFSGNLAITPDGKYVVSGDTTLKLSDSSTGNVVDAGLDAVALDPGMKGLATPSFAPDGTEMAAVEMGGTSDWQYWDYAVTPNSALVLLDFDPVTLRFKPELVKLVDSTAFAAGEQTINYPSFSPDSKWVAYQVADHNSGCWVYPSGCQTTTTEKGSIYLQSVDGGAPIRLTRLSDPPGGVDPDLSLEPTFNPIARGGYFWLVFTSERSWGNDPDVQGAPDNDKKRLWVSAIDAAPGTTDPSHPAFFLEGQDTTTQNMRGFWTLSACIPTPGSGELATPDAGSAACVNGFDCCSGFCQNGQCIGVNQTACAPVGGACTTAADCCNPTAVSCQSGTCQVTFR